MADGKHIAELQCIAYLSFFCLIVLILSHQSQQDSYSSHAVGDLQKLVACYDFQKMRSGLMCSIAGWAGVLSCHHWFESCFVAPTSDPALCSCAWECTEGWCCPLHRRPGWRFGLHSDWTGLLCLFGERDMEPARAVFSLYNPIFQTKSFKNIWSDSFMYSILWQWEPW